MNVIELILVTVSFALLGFYHALLWYRIRRTPERTSIGANQTARRLWVEMIVDEKQDLLAVHNLRNWATAASLLTTSSILIGLG
ncbi:MAG: DUF599 family protein, partial [Magnetococcales bacterium]|nr:DUF599 family protein [Magnetococcales bacterium]